MESNRASFPQRYNMARGIKINLINKLDESKININAINFEREFSTKQTTKIVEFKKEDKKVKKSYLDGKDLQILNIIIQKYKLDYIDIIYNLLTYNIDYFSKDLCDGLA